jgi:PHD/YefM family antitoxin component YafN of YafNO toxin-antitoxin module
MRDFGTMLTELEEGEVQKLVLTQRNRVRAIVVSVERWSELEEALEGRSVQVDRLPGEVTPAQES